MNQLPLSRRVQILQMLCEGSSMRSISRIADVSINTVVKLLVDAGNVCAGYQDKTLKNLTCSKIQVDEIWSFVYAKEKNVPNTKKGRFGFGDVWTFTALDADSKLIISWAIGNRDAVCATEFMRDLASRLKNRVQLTTDGHKMYLEAVEDAFGADIDFSQLIKIYGKSQDKDAEIRYSPAQCIGTEKHKINGNPKKKNVSTSFVERQNLSMRMGMRRFTRLTNAFSKKIENHFHALAIYFMVYNFCRIHQTIRMTPAMKAGVTDRLWDIEDILSLLK